MGRGTFIALLVGLGLAAVALLVRGTQAKQAAASSTRSSASAPPASSPGPVGTPVATARPVPGATAGGYDAGAPPVYNADRYDATGAPLGPEASVDPGGGLSVGEDF